MIDWYEYKADQCDRLAAAATNTRERVKYKEEGALWRGIAKDLARRNRDEAAAWQVTSTGRRN